MNNILSYDEFNINDYDLIYHIFLMNYINFNKIFIYPQNKEVRRTKSYNRRG
jgi:antirestriction protein